MLKVVIVGAGLMGYHHAKAARYLGATVVGVIDPDTDACARFCRHFPGATPAATLDAMQAQQAFDVAHVCSPASTHLPMALALAGAGVSALVEKPLVETADEARSVTEAFTRAGALVCPVHQYAFQRGMTHALSALPRIGPIKRVSFEIASAGGLGAMSRLDAVAGDILPHPLSMLQRLLPDVALSRLAWVVVRADQGEWTISTTSQGTALSIALSMGSRPTGFSTRIAGARGTMELDNFHGYAVELAGTVSRARKITQPFIAAGKHLSAGTLNLCGRTLRRETAYPGLREIIAQFYRAVDSGDANLLPVSVTQSIDAAAARDAILLSGRADG